MSSFSDPNAVARYAENLVRQVPAVHTLHQLAGLLLRERVPADGRVLALGAGGGMELKAFADANPGWRLLGVDPSPEMLDLAVRTLGALAPRVELIRGYVDDAPDTLFDGATCLLTLHFLSRDERLHTLRELKRRLKPGAPLVIAHHSVPDDIDEKLAWFRRHAAFVASNGVPAADAQANALAIANRLPTLSPEAEVELLLQAGFTRPSLFYAAFTFRGWVAFA
ncbi:class I SAM-dependent methyltransferase [Thermomonas carbonis]|uniref:Class I SAM-dependent methyltransferase n=1 Tax=Thermomonas carbonis TaxID=1463158 RepID=A0A7G9SSY9_9GAMM|nr:class I SAM-dependent methyltransferase [Thermomonas carbonis]QNN70964.1 class I SAM-dependent methyltransferase [Thermomonas carbonis]